MTTSAYKDLNLREGAGEMEIRAAFRRMAKENHPDSNQTGDVSRFRKACAAYKELMRRLRAQNETLTLHHLHPASAPFVFEAKRTAGLDVYFDIAMVRPRPDLPFTLVIPSAAHEACPRCLGQGRTLSRVNDGSSVYRPRVCPKCSGRGSISRPKDLAVTVTPEMAERGRFRLRQAGGYLPKEAKRGDLVVNIRWVDDLPTGN
jgi:DnaJ-class molecular chaperone